MQSSAETGWYDGQTWLKPQAELVRERLLNTHTVLPAVRRIRICLIAAAATCCTSAAVLMASAPPVSQAPPEPAPLAALPCVPSAAARAGSRSLLVADACAASLTGDSTMCGVAEHWCHAASRLRDENAALVFTMQRRHGISAGLASSVSLSRKATQI